MASDPRTNELKRTVERDEVALGLLDNLYDPTVVELCGELGVDFVWHDFEHGGPSPWDGDRLAELLRAAELTGTELLVRLPVSEPALVRKALDVGARSLFLSRVETAGEVREAVAAARFEYDGEPGERGLAAPRARRWGLADDYVRTEDEAAFVGVTIETEAAVENIDEILAVPELDFVFLGPLDYSVSAGRPGEADHADVTEPLEDVRERALDAGVAVGGLGFGMDDVSEKAERGYRILHVGSATGALQSDLTAKLADFDPPN